MANGKLIISHNGVAFEPPLEEGVQIEWERTGSPGKLTFKTIKATNDMVFQEGDPVGFYYDNKLVFAGYVFSKKCDREHFIDVTCYDQIRYLKNKYTYVFEKKTAAQIIKSLCNDFSLSYGTLTDTKYVIPTIVEENKAALDIILTVLEETLVNTGEMYVLYDDGGKLQLKNVVDLSSATLICEDTAENFDYSSSIDDETYNEVVLYYDANSKSTSSTSSGTVSTSDQAQAILDMAKSQIGTAENPMGTKNVKYNTEYYGREINTSTAGAYHWCCVFVWWVFKECGLSSLLYDGEKINNQQTLAGWFKDKGDLHTENFKPGDVVFFNWDGGRLDHVGFVESVDGNKVTCIEGNVNGVVKRVVRNRNCIQSVGRPRYSSTKASATSTTSSGSNSWGNNSIQLYTAYSPSKIKEWGLLRYFEKVDTPSIGQNKANALLQLYNRKTRELKVTGAFGDIKVRGGTLLPVKLNLGDVEVSNFMLVEKVKHKFDNDHHTMDLTLQGAWDDSTNDMLSQTIGELPTPTTTSTPTSPTTPTTPKSSSDNGKTYNISLTCNGIITYAGAVNITYTLNGQRKRVSKTTGAFGFKCDEGTTTLVSISEKSGCSHIVSAISGSYNRASKKVYEFKMNKNTSITVKWIGAGGAGRA